MDQDDLATVAGVLVIGVFFLAVARGMGWL